MVMDVQDNRAAGPVRDIQSIAQTKRAVVILNNQAPFGAFREAEVCSFEPGLRQSLVSRDSADVQHNNGLRAQFHCIQDLGLNLEFLDRGFNHRLIL